VAQQHVRKHAAGDTVLVFMPYSKGQLSGLRFGDLAAGLGQRRVFGPTNPSTSIGQD
jgi:hypothetical protein